jgi:hypothetical protein
VSKNPAPSIICSDGSVSCIVSTLVAPPHSVLSLKRCLSKYENIYIDTNLFLSASSRSPIDDGRDVSILASDGLGSKPLALVVISNSLLCPDPLTPLPQTNKLPEARYGM